MRRELVDDLGEPVSVPRLPRRVVSLVPSLTEAIEETVPGALVGATDYCTHPARLDVARVGGTKYPRVDEVRALRPDLVVANAEENRAGDVDKLRADGIPVWVTAAAPTVPAALGSLRRLLCVGFAANEPDWLVAAEEAWREVLPVVRTAIVPVWRRPWVVLGRDTFAGDVLARLGIANAYAHSPERYPRPPIEELQGTLRSGRADLVVLPDEPYAFDATDGPEVFGDALCAFVSGRHLTWYGPSLLEAHTHLATQLSVTTSD